MVKRGSGIRTFRDLAHRTVVITSGTTNEKVIRDLDQHFQLGLKLLVGRDHDESYAKLAAGEADAFATDDVLLQGLIAKNKSGDKFIVTGDLLSYEPYGIVFKKGDRQLATLIARVMRERAQNRDWEMSYQQWFMNKLPDGERIDLPMSPQLAEIIASMKLTAD
jgi:glutamate/aspartate transport system substrate-binding protein